MILDTLEHMDIYKEVSPRLHQAMQLIRSTDFSKQEDGSYEVDGFEFRYLLQSYTTQETNETPEAHRDFIDLQYIISGKENVGIGQLENMKGVVESYPDRDLWFYHGPVDKITLNAGSFAIFFPNDVHAPCITPPDGPCQVRKCVFKIHV